MYSFFPAKTFRQRATKRPERKVIFRAPRFFQYLLDQVELLNRVHLGLESQVGHSNINTAKVNKVIQKGPNFFVTIR